jgi:hypothetical protein
MSKEKITITEIKNNLPDVGATKEKFGIYVPNIDENLPHHNGTIWAIIGSGGSGKSSLFLSLFKSKKFLKQKFDEVHYIVSQRSFDDVEKNPFTNHTNIHHELTADLLYEIHEDALDRKEEAEDNNEPYEYTCVVIDDFGSELKRLDIQQALKEIMNIARHANMYFIFICQSYIMLPMELRRILTHITIFKPNCEQWNTIIQEVLLKKKNVAEQIYNYVFDKLYNHLMINIKDGTLYKNFNKLEIK